MALNFLSHSHLLGSKVNSFDIAAAIQRGELVVSVSSMLGCDYIFISHVGSPCASGNQTIGNYYPGITRYDGNIALTKSDSKCG